MFRKRISLAPFRGRGQGEGAANTERTFSHPLTPTLSPTYVGAREDFFV
jgi:hypothetical protein